MKILEIKKDSIDFDLLTQALHVLQKGGIVAHPTDTCYGFAADVFNKKAVARLRFLKNMADDKPISMIVYNLSEAEKYAHVTEKARCLIRQYWPGPLTVVLRRKPILPSFYNPSQKTIGLRCPDCLWSRALVQKLGRPITTTSANVSGMPSPYSVQDILTQYQNRQIQLDLILDAGILPFRKPSTIVEVLRLDVNIIRQGDLKIKFDI